MIEFYQIDFNNHHVTQFLNIFRNNKSIQKYLGDINIFTNELNNQKKFEYLYLIGKSNNLIGIFNHYKSLKNKFLLFTLTGNYQIMSNNSFIKYQVIDFLKFYIDENNVDNIDSAQKIGFRKYLGAKLHERNNNY